LAIILFAIAVGGTVFTVLFTAFYRTARPSHLLTPVGAGYAVSALIAGVGLWRVARWGRAALVVWGVFAVALTVLVSAGGSPLWQVILMGLVAGATVLALAAYVHRSVRGTR
jgi:uncharacterized membrane protein (DUF2068 family)